MKGIIITLFSVTALISAATVDTRKCHNDPSEVSAICNAAGSEGVLVAHDKCNKFYKCSHGKPVAFKCPYDLLYNPELEVCDWSRDVDCGNRIIPDHDKESVEENEAEKEVNNDPNKAPEICAKHESVLVAHEICNYFYQCASGKPVARRCPRGLLYNYYIEQCDWPRNVDCGKRIILEFDEDKDKEPEDDVTENDIAGHDDPSEAPAICAEEGSDSVLVAHELCNKFYICASGIPIALECPNGLLYNPNKERCDWPDAVECGGRTPPVDDDKNCDQGGNDVEDEDINHSEIAQKICAQGGSFGRHLPHEYCDKFYVCIFNRAVSMTCPFKFLFNSERSKCDWPSNVDCKGRIDPRGKICQKTLSYDQGIIYGHSSTAKKICSDGESDGTLVSHKYCNKFYQCVGLQPVALSCPSILHFSPEDQHCDWPENVDCGDRIIPEETEDDEDKDDSDDDYKPEGNNFDDPSQAPKICAKENSDGTHIAHEYCNKFYICVNRRPVGLECPENLWYNPKIERCDWQKNVECNGRQLP